MQRYASAKDLLAAANEVRLSVVLISPIAEGLGIVSDPVRLAAVAMWLTGQRRGIYHALPEPAMV